MKEMWDYESREPFSGKIEKAPEKPRGSQVKSSNECELCGGNHKVEQCLTKESLVWEQIPLVLIQKKNFLMVRVKV